MSGLSPAALGGTPAFGDGLALVRPQIAGRAQLLQRLEGILDSGMLTNGPTVRELEETVAAYLGVAHVVAVANCTAGLMLVYQALGARGPVVLPSFTFAASAHAVIWAGGTPEFADVSAESLTLDGASAAGALEGAVAMSATHVYGTPCDTETLQRLADEAGVPLVYDAAHGLGSRRAGVPIGNFGTAEVFSLSPTKVTVAGEGGLVTTRDAALAETLRIGRDYGNPGDYDCAFPGLNARLSELHAAVALASLLGLDERVVHRTRLVDAFWAAVAGVPGLRRPVVAPGDTSTYKDLTVIVDPAAFGLEVPQLSSALRAEGADSRRYYFPPIHRQKAYASYPPTLPLPVTDALAEHVLTLPLWSQQSESDATRLGEVVARLHTHAPELAAVLP